MEAIGFIETIGITAAIVGADAMLKSANVNILERKFVGGGMVSIAVTGDVGAVTAAVEAGTSSIKNLDSSLIVTNHIIPRPEQTLENTVIFPIVLKKDLQEQTETQDLKQIKENQDKNIDRQNKTNKDPKQDPVKEYTEEGSLEVDQSVDADNSDKLEFEENKIINKKDLDKLVKEHGIEKTDKVLWEMKMKELRKLARKYDDFGIKGRDISTASKEVLISEFNKYYQ